MIKKDKSIKQTNIFIFFIFIFPVIIESLSYLLNSGLGNFSWDVCEWLKSLFSIFKSYMSFYGTALTITFTVYSFNKAQEKYHEEQMETNVLKAKELEARRDYYRPTFVIERSETGSCDYVKLLMRNDNLYLEEVKYYSSLKNLSSIDQESVKSGQRIARKDETVNSFYITAKTQIGETILFGYLNGGIKIYKYLKVGDKAIIPTFGHTLYNQKEIDAIWGTYNDDIENSDRSLDQILFYNTVQIREKIVFNYNNSLAKTLAAKSINEFFKSVFHEIVDEFNLSHFTSNSIDESIRFMLLDLKNSIDSIELSEEVNQSYDYLKKQSSQLSYKPKDWIILDYDELDLDKFLELVTSSLHYCRYNLNEKERVINYKALLRILMKVFDNIKIDESLDYKVYEYKSMIYNKLEFIS